MQEKIRFQPIISLKNDKIFGYEALYKKNFDENYPSAVKMLDNIFSSEILQPNCQLFINMTINDISEQNFCNLLLNVLEKWKIDAQKIVLEINEATHPDAIRAAKKSITLLREHNLKIALDDFGTEYSNIFYITELPIDIIKIDKKFVQESPDHQKLRTLIKHCVAMAHDFGCLVVAEGIEKAEHLACMLDAQVDIGQGFLFSAPSLNVYQNSPFISLPDFVKYLSTTNEKYEPYLRVAHHISQSQYFEQACGF